MKGATGKGKGKARAEDTLGLETREAEILESIVGEHILSGEPIASGKVSRSGKLGLSSATIRSVMSSLERRGLLAQPHASAGRVPTDLAYRWYVDQVVPASVIPGDAGSAIRDALTSNRGQVAGLLSETSRLLSRFSNQIGVVLAPRPESFVLQRVEFVRLDPRRVLAVVVGRSGVVHNRVLRAAEPETQEELTRTARQLTDEFGGRTLPEIRRQLERRIDDARHAFARRAVLHAEAADAGLIVEGASNVVGAPEFSDPEKIRALIRTLEHKQALVSLLANVLDTPGVQVVIGDEHPGGDLAECSVVASSYGFGGRGMGSVGVIGPKRMEYARIIALVDHLAGELSRVLSGEGIDDPGPEDQIS